MKLTNRAFPPFSGRTGFGTIVRTMLVVGSVLLSVPGIGEEASSSISGGLNFKERKTTLHQLYKSRLRKKTVIGGK